MKRLHFTFGLCMLLGFMPLTTTAQVVNDDNEDGVVKINNSLSMHDYVQGQVLVKFKDGNGVQVSASRGKFRSTSNNRLTQLLQQYGAEQMEQLLPSENPDRPMRRAKSFNGDIVQECDLSQLYRIQLSDEHAYDMLQLINELKQMDEVEFAEPNYLLHTLETPESHIADSYDGNGYASQQWYLDAYGVTQLWNKAIVNSERPIIAILDTGVDITHPDLVDNIWTNTTEAEGESGYDNDGNGFKGDVHGWDFINNTGNMRDNNMHGTHVAGIAAACNNDIGIVGANPQALIMPVTVMQSDGTGDVATIVKGINYAVASGATVLNLSLGSYANSSALRLALGNAYQSAVIVAAAGNDFLKIELGPMFPAAYSFVLGVQAVAQGGYFAGFSNFDNNGPNYSPVSTLQDPDGYNYELKAPGVDMLSTIPGGKYKALNGTSMAAPLVAGAISALKMVKDYDTQEILWGDLTHTDNIAQAYALTERPAELDLLRVQLQNRKDLEDETEADYSGDNEIDAGEIVSVYPVIRTTFGAASNIKMHLEMGDEFEDPTTVEIYSDSEHKVDFGMHLDAYGRGVSLNPLELKVANNVADARHIKLKIVATCDESTETFEKPFTIVVTNMVKISGLISEDRTLTANHVYYVNGDLAVVEGATLTIEAGTRLEFGARTKLQSYGKLIANGKPGKPIVFARHVGEDPWYGIYTYQSGYHGHDQSFYTNADSTLFTLCPTEYTTLQKSAFSQIIYYNSQEEENPRKSFYLKDYLDNFNKTVNAEKQTDPSYLTPAMLRAIEDWKAYYNQYPTQPTEGKQNYDWVHLNGFEWTSYDNPIDTISYCMIEGHNDSDGQNYRPYMKDCVVKPDDGYNTFRTLEGERTTIHDVSRLGGELSSFLTYSNIVNAKLNVLLSYNRIHYNNFLNNLTGSGYILYYNPQVPSVDKSDYPSYLGTAREDLVRPYIYEMGNGGGYGWINLDNMPNRPYEEAHGIVWKVVVNGKDAQDEYEQLAPLGVGKHKFEVYFNRPMNKAVAPTISFGVRDPYTQQAVNEDGSWNAEGTIYTAYKTITGKTKSDGVNRIYVYGAEDNEYFEIPYEKSRFNINVQAAGSMATDLMAVEGLGRVTLKFEKTKTDYEDAIGINIYRCIEGTTDTLLVNADILDIETTEYPDYDVVPGTTYQYLYKVLSTDLQVCDVSNTVAATPQTSTMGDANGSGEVDVADVITTVNYAAGESPKPFIFEAADMNSDQMIDILDVIGIIQKILHPASEARVMAEGMATYTVEDGTLYVDCDVPLSGVQVQLSLSDEYRAKHDEFATAEDLKGFEHVSAWLSDNDYLFLAYNLGGKTLTPGHHALLHIGDAQVNTVRLSDAAGRNVKAVGSEATGIDRMGRDVMTVKGVYDLQGRKLGDAPLQKGVYIIDGVKVVKL